MSQLGSDLTDNSLLQAAARYSIRAVFLEDATGNLTPLLGAEAPPDLISAISEIRAENPKKSGVHRVGSVLVVRTPASHDQRAIVWVTEGPLATITAQLVELNKLSNLFLADQIKSAQENVKSDVKDLATLSLAVMPEEGKAKFLKQLAMSVSQRCDWDNLIILEVVKGRLKHIYSSTQYGYERRENLNVFVSNLSDEERYFSSQKSDSDPSVAFYLDAYEVSLFSLYAPENGFGLYLENASDKEELAYVADLLNKRKPQRVPIQKSWRSGVAIGLVIAAVLFALWPVPRLIGAPAQIQPAVSELQIARHEASVVDIRVQVGDKVAKGDVLAVLSSPQVEAAHEKASLDLALELLNAQQALGSDDLAAYDLAQQRANILQLRADQTARHVEELTLKANVAGRVAAVIDQGQIGALLSVGSVISEIQKSSQMKTLLTLNPSDGALVSKGMEGELLLRGVINRTYQITLLEDPALMRGAEGQQTLTVLAELHGETSDALYKGLSGFAQITGAKGPRALNYLRPLAEFIRITIWKYTGWRI